MNYILNLFFPRPVTVAGLIAGFEKTARALDALAIREDERQELLTAQLDESIAERQRAVRAADKLHDLID